MLKGSLLNKHKSNYYNCTMYYCSFHCNIYYFAFLANIHLNKRYYFILNLDNYNKNFHRLHYKLLSKDQLESTLRYTIHMHHYQTCMFHFYILGLACCLKAFLLCTLSHNIKISQGQIRIQQHCIVVVLRIFMLSDVHPKFKHTEKQPEVANRS